MAKTFLIRTFGCQMNRRDSEIMARLLAKSGWQPTDAPQTADLVLVNTCSVRDKAEQKVYGLLGQLRDMRAKGGKPALIGVCGCVAQQEGERLVARMPAVNLVIGTQQFYLLPALLDRLERGERHVLALGLDAHFAIPAFQKLWRDAADTPEPPETPIQGSVNIMQGCDNFCSYCVVPYTRGRETSRPVTDILEEVRLLVDRGVKEITLLGQNVNSYGKTNAVADRPVGFPELLRQVAAIPGLSRLRFTTSHPKDLSPELMRCFAELPTLCPHFHLPAQSGSNAILARMNRGYTAEDYLAKIDELRRVRPDISLATDFIVGFPGETEADFAGTLQLLESVRFHASFSFKYSDRPQARSAAFPDKVPEEVKAGRLARLQTAQEAISLEWNRQAESRAVEILVETVDENGGQGRTATNQVTHFRADSGNVLPRPGELANVLVEHAGAHSLRGVLQ